MSNPADRRAFGRRRTTIHAIARIPGRPPERCILRNVSEGGALLDFERKIKPPFRFELAIEGYDLVGRCEVRHEGNHGVGVMFMTPGLGETLVRIGKSATENGTTAQKTSSPTSSAAQRSEDALSSFLAAGDQARQWCNTDTPTSRSDGFDALKYRRRMQKTV